MLPIGLLVSLIQTSSNHTFLFASDLGSLPQLVLEKHAGEGPAWNARLGLFFSGGGDITRLDQNEKAILFRKNAGSNGLLFDREGRLYICEAADRRVTRLELDGSLTVLTDNYRGKKYNQPNDLSVDHQGRIYFSDPRYGSRENMEMLDADGRKIEGVYRIDSPGKVTRIITHEVDRPNGLLISGDRRHLFVADNNNNMEGGARKLWRFNFKKDGNLDLNSRHLVFDWKTARGPDGMAQDLDGRLYVASGLNRSNLPFETSNKYKGGIYVFSAKGEFADFWPIPRDEVTNCTFGGKDMKTLYITAGGSLWSVRVKTPGRPSWPSGN